MAAQFHREQKTAHSKILIFVFCNETTSSHLEPGSGKASKLKRVDLAIWDEARRWMSQGFEAIDRSQKDLVYCYEAFGGKVILFLGAIWWILLVPPRWSKAGIETSFFK